MFHDILLFLVAMFAGALNSVAGGGTFFLFPALMASGLAPVAANVTSTITVWPASLSGAWAYQKHLAHENKLLVGLACASVLGGACGAALLLLMPAKVFETLVPWLLLLATILYSFGSYTRYWFKSEPSETLEMSCSLLVGQFLVSVYGGYFGAGIGILMLALFTIWGMQHIHAMNAMKTLLAIFINGVAVCVFLWSDQADWQKLLFLVPAALLGGYAGATLALKVPAALVRRIVACFAWALTGYYFLKSYSALFT